MKTFKTLVDKEIQSVPELSKIYEELIPLFEDRTLLLLSGSVGAGKTTSVQCLGTLMGMTDVASPSFAIHHRYENKHGKSIDHVDLYRLKDEDDLESTGFWDLFGQAKSLVIIEWADRLDAEALPLNWLQVRVHIEVLAGTLSQRRIVIKIQN